MAVSHRLPIRYGTTSEIQLTVMLKMANTSYSEDGGGTLLLDCRTLMQTSDYSYGCLHTLDYTNAITSDRTVLFSVSGNSVVVLTKIMSQGISGC